MSLETLSPGVLEIFSVRELDGNPLTNDRRRIRRQHKAPARFWPIVGRPQHGFDQQETPPFVPEKLTGDQSRNTDALFVLTMIVTHSAFAA
ncbi:MAG: hypothetical protein ACYCOU_11445 [Sulfobacillus sp.]